MALRAWRKLLWLARSREPRLWQLAIPLRRRVFCREIRRWRISHADRAVEGERIVGHALEADGVLVTPEKRAGNLQDVALEDRADVPDAGGRVVGRGDDARPVGAEGGGSDLSHVAAEDGNRLSVAASQTRAVSSEDAVTMRDPSGLKAAELTEFSWPLRTAIALPVVASQMRAVWSLDAVTICAPSGLKAAE